MELDPKEQALVRLYLKTSSGQAARWILELILGLLVCVVALGAAKISDEASVDNFAMVLLLAGLGLTAWALDDRKRAILAGVIQKYHKALGEHGDQQ
jgi:hypothetical protein